MQKVIKNEPFSAYAARDALNASSLKNLLVSGTEFAYRKIHGFSSPSTELGRICHSLKLEKDKFNEEYAIWPGNTRAGQAWDCYQALCNKSTVWAVETKSKTSKVWKETLANAQPGELHFLEKDFNAAANFYNEHKGKEPISKADLERAQKMVDSIEDHPIAGPIFERSCAEEITLLWEAMGEQCKARLDSMDPRYINDIKTTAVWPLDKRNFTRICRNLKYHMSAAFYVDAYTQLFGKVPGFRIIAVASQGACETAVFELPDGVLEEGRELYQEAILRWKNWNGAKLEEVAKHGIATDGVVVLDDWTGADKVNTFFDRAGVYTADQPVGEEVDQC